MAHSGAPTRFEQYLQQRKVDASAPVAALGGALRLTDNATPKGDASVAQRAAGDKKQAGHARLVPSGAPPPPLRVAPLALNGASCMAPKPGGAPPHQAPAAPVQELAAQAHMHHQQAIRDASQQQQQQQQQARQMQGQQLAFVLSGAAAPNAPGARRSPLALARSEGSGTMLVATRGSRPLPVSSPEHEVLSELAAAASSLATAANRLAAAADAVTANPYKALARAAADLAAGTQSEAAAVVTVGATTGAPSSVVSGRPAGDRGSLPRQQLQPGQATAAATAAATAGASWLQPFAGGEAGAFGPPGPGGGGGSSGRQRCATPKFPGYNPLVHVLHSSLPPPGCQPAVRPATSSPITHGFMDAAYRSATSAPSRGGSVASRQLRHSTVGLGGGAWEHPAAQQQQQLPLLGLGLGQEGGEEEGEEEGRAAAAAARFSAGAAGGHVRSREVLVLGGAEGGAQQADTLLMRASRASSCAERARPLPPPLPPLGGWGPGPAGLPLSEEELAQHEVDRRYNKVLAELQDRICAHGPEGLAGTFRPADYDDTGTVGLLDFLAVLQRSLGPELVDPQVVGLLLAGMGKDPTAPGASRINYREFVTAMRLNRLPWRAYHPKLRGRWRAGGADAAPGSSPRPASSAQQQQQPAQAAGGSMVWADVREACRAVDLDNDGLITLKELQVAMQAVAAKHGTSAPGQEMVKVLRQAGWDVRKGVAYEELLRAIGGGGALAGRPARQMDPAPLDCSWESQQQQQQRGPAAWQRQRQQQQRPWAGCVDGDGGGGDGSGENGPTCCAGIGLGSELLEQLQGGEGQEQEGPGAEGAWRQPIERWLLASEAIADPASAVGGLQPGQQQQLALAGAWRACGAAGGGGGRRGANAGASMLRTHQGAAAVLERLRTAGGGRPRG